MLIGSGAIVLNGAVVEDEALVGRRRAGVRAAWWCRAGRWPSACPATLKLDAVEPGPHIKIGMEVYRERGRTYREQLRRLD